MKKYFYYICILILLFFISIIPASAKEIKMCTRSNTNLHVRDSMITGSNYDDIMSTPCVDNEAKVYDFAELLTDEDEEKLYNEIQTYIEKTGYDLVIVTINQNNKYDSTRYADDFYDYNDFGFNKSRDGILILMDMALREIRISTTGYAIKMYSDYRCDSVYQYGKNYATNGSYFTSFEKMISKLSDYFDEGVPESNINLNFDENGKPYYIKFINYSFVGVISLIVTLIVSIIFYNTSKSKIKVGSTISYMKNKNITVKTDKLVNSIVTHHLRNTDSSSGGLSGGGSTFHSSSSGSFHGGGGGKF